MIQCLSSCFFEFGILVYTQLYEAGPPYSLQLLSCCLMHEYLVLQVRDAAQLGHIITSEYKTQPHKRSTRPCNLPSYKEEILKMEGLLNTIKIMFEVYSIEVDFR